MKLGYSLDGDPAAPVLVLSGSLGSTLAMWEPQVAAFGEHFAVLRFDHPGHGKSAPAERPLAIDDLGAAAVALLDELELERVSFCGLSLGGMIGMWLGAQAPERIERLALCCTSARLGPREFWEERAALVRRDGMAAVAGTVVGRWFTRSFHEARPDLVEIHREMLLAADPESYARCCEAIRDLDLRRDLSRIAAPTVVVAGAEDPSTPVEQNEAVADAIAGAHLVVIPDAAHLANVQQPRAFNDAVLEHVAVAT
jgi:3-oxoadipate enol-lactonase